MNNRKVLVIGLDGAYLDIIKQNLDKLPNFSRMMKDGVSGTLKSTIPPLTSPAWLSFMTGKNPEKLNIFGFIKRKAQTYEPEAVNSNFLYGETLWRILSENERRVIVLNVPLTFPAQTVNGILISGFPVPEGSTNYIYPRELKLELEKIVGGYTATRTLSGALVDDNVFLKELYRLTEMLMRTTKYLISKYDWDFFMVVFMGTDDIQHFFWKYMDPKHPRYDPTKAKVYGGEILKYYQKIDECLGNLIKSVNNDTIVIIMSDHGFGPYYGRFAANDWLIEKGYLKLMDEPQKNWLLKFGLIREDLDKYAAYARILLEKYSLKKILRFSRYLFYRLWTKVIRYSYPSLWETKVDWLRSVAYAWEWTSIFINVKGREPKGIVEPGKQYEEVQNSIIEELENLSDPRTNRKLNVRILKKKKPSSEGYNTQIPDIIFSINDFEIGTNLTVGHDEVIDYKIEDPSGFHRLDGIFLMKGKGVKKGVETQAEIIDLTPTILHIMNVPIPSDVDGKVIREAFEAYLAGKEARHKEASGERPEEKHVLSKDEDEQIKKRLKELGYL